MVDILKLTLNQHVGIDIPCTIIFMIGGTAFWIYTWNFVFNIIEGSLRGGLTGKSKGVQDVVHKLRLATYSTMVITTISCWSFTITLIAGQNNWELQQGTS